MPYVLLAAVVISSSFFMRGSFFATDEGGYYYEAQKLMRGQVIYRDYFRLITPGVYFYIEALWRIFGQRVDVVRYSLMVLCVFEVWLVYWLGLRILRPAWIAFVPPLLFIEMAKQRFWWSIQHHVLSHFTVLLCGYLLVRYLVQRSMWRLFWLGLFVGITICVTQHVGALLLLGISFWVAFDWMRQRGPRALSALVPYAAGAAIPVFLLCAYLVANGALGDAYECLIIFPLSGYRAFHAVPYFYDGSRWLTQQAPRLPVGSALREGLHVIMIGYVPPVALMLGLVRLLRRALRRRPPHDSDCELSEYGAVWTVATVLFCTALTYPTIFKISQHATLSYIFLLEFVSSPLLVWLRVALPQPAGLAEDRRAAVRESKPWTTAVGFLRARFDLSLRTALALSSGALLFYLAVDAIQRIHRFERGQILARPTRIYVQTPLGRLWTYDRQFASDLTELSAFVRQHTSSSDRIFVYYWSPYLYPVLDRDGATRLSATLPGYHQDRASAQTIAALGSHAAALVIEDRMVDRLLQQADPRILAYRKENPDEEPIARAVHSSYAPGLRLTNFTVYLPRAGPSAQELAPPEPSHREPPVSVSLVQKTKLRLVRFPGGERDPGPVGLTGVLEATLRNTTADSIKLLDLREHGVVFTSCEDGKLHVVVHSCKCVKDMTDPEPATLLLPAGETRSVVVEDWGCGGGMWPAPPPGCYRIEYRVILAANAPRPPSHTSPVEMIRWCKGNFTSAAWWEGSIRSKPIEIRLEDAARPARH